MAKGSVTTNMMNHTNPLSVNNIYALNFSIRLQN